MRCPVELITWIYLRQFYETALGRKLIQSMPALTAAGIKEPDFARRIFENR
jgi:hypothetical protein